MKFGVISIIILSIYYSQDIYSTNVEDKFQTTSVIFENSKIVSLKETLPRRLTELTILPNLTLQTPEEGDYLQFHRCFNEGEAYAAAYLITKQHVLNHRIEHDLSTANTEVASFIVFDNGNNKDDTNIRSGTITMALDAFDFSVIHLSAYERLIRRHRIHEKSPFFAIEECTNSLIDFGRIWKNNSYYQYDFDRLNRTVVIMPWLGNEVGVGNSHVENRISYLKACFWSFYPMIPHVAVGVKNMNDYNYLKNHSELPLFEVLLLDTIPTSSSLPLATLQAARLNILEKRWDFDYVYFTESDQVLVWRPESIRDVFAFLDKYPRRVLVPHRLIPYPVKLLRVFHRPDGPEGRGNGGWINMSCCFPRQNCIERKTWSSPKKNDTLLHFVNMFGLQVALGNANFHEETFRACDPFIFKHLEVCP